MRLGHDEIRLWNEFKISRVGNCVNRLGSMTATSLTSECYRHYHERYVINWFQALRSQKSVCYFTSHALSSYYKGNQKWCGCSIQNCELEKSSSPCIGCKVRLNNKCAKGFISVCCLCFWAVFKPIWPKELLQRPSLMDGVPYAPWMFLPPIEKPFSRLDKRRSYLKEVDESTVFQVGKVHWNPHAEDFVFCTECDRYDLQIIYYII